MRRAWCVTILWTCRIFTKAATSNKKKCSNMRHSVLVEVLNWYQITYRLCSFYEEGNAKKNNNPFGLSSRGASPRLVLSTCLDDLSWSEVRRLAAHTLFIPAKWVFPGWARREPSHCKKCPPRKQMQLVSTKESVFQRAIETFSNNYDWAGFCYCMFMHMMIFFFSAFIYLFFLNRGCILWIEVEKVHHSS